MVDAWVVVASIWAIAVTTLVVLLIAGVFTSDAENAESNIVRPTSTQSVSIGGNLAYVMTFDARKLRNNTVEFHSLLMPQMFTGEEPHVFEASDIVVSVGTNTADGDNYVVETTEMNELTVAQNGTSVAVDDSVRPEGNSLWTIAAPSFTIDASTEIVIVGINITSGIFDSGTDEGVPPLNPLRAELRIV